MGKKRSAKAVVEEKPDIWCFYCEREFDDEKVLIQHQKAKHFKCDHCHKKLSTAGGLVVHIVQVHKETIKSIPNAKPERESTDFEIYGMSGIPDEFLSDKAKAKKNGADRGNFPPPLPPSAYGGYQGGMPMMMPQIPFPAMPMHLAPPPPGHPQFQPQLHQYPPPGYPMPPMQQMHMMPPRPPTPNSQFPGMPPGFAPHPGMQQPVPAPSAPQLLQNPLGLPSNHPYPPPMAPTLIVPGAPLESGVPEESAQPPVAPVAQPVPGELVLIWADDDFSMEERRAELVKYRVASSGTAEDVAADLKGYGAAMSANYR